MANLLYLFVHLYQGVTNSLEKSAEDRLLELLDQLEEAITSIGRPMDQFEGTANENQQQPTAASTSERAALLSGDQVNQVGSRQQSVLQLVYNKLHEANKFFEDRMGALSSGNHADTGRFPMGSSGGAGGAGGTSGTSAASEANVVTNSPSRRNLSSTFDSFMQRSSKVTTHNIYIYIYICYFANLFFLLTHSLSPVI